MTDIYVVIIKATGKDYYYTTKTAIGRAHSREEIGIQPSTVKDVKFKDGVYENRYCIIKKRVLYNNNDVK